MLSICIAIHNWNVGQLVNDLAAQATRLGVPYEILLLDDASDERFRIENQPLLQIPFTSYSQSEKNLGRSAVRNTLAHWAKYPYLLFMDCDTAVCDDNYLQNYLDALPAQVVVGGYGYPSQRPEQPYVLRWKYGRTREIKSAAVRSQHANCSFSTFNFLIEKSIFQKVRFDEKLQGYGHEDTLFGLDLQRNGITVTHIDNALMHCVRCENDVYLKQIENSIDNLIHLCENYPYKQILIENISLLRTYNKIQHSFTEKCFRKFYSLFSNRILRNLHSLNPDIRFLDYFKLNYLCSKNIDL